MQGFLEEYNGLRPMGTFYLSTINEDSQVYTEFSGRWKETADGTFVSMMRYGRKVKCKVTTVVDIEKYLQYISTSNEVYSHPGDNPVYVELRTVDKQMLMVAEAVNASGGKNYKSNKMISYRDLKICQRCNQRGHFSSKYCPERMYHGI